MSERVLMPVFYTIEHDGRVERCANALSTDHDVTVVCIHSGDPEPDEVREDWSCERIRLPSRSGAVAHLLFWVRLLVLSLRLQPTVVHAHDYYMALPGYLCALLNGAAFVYDAHELIIVDDWAAAPTRRKVWYLLERSVVGRTTLVICANQRRAELMADHYDLETRPTVVSNASPPPENALSTLPEDFADAYPTLRRDHGTTLVYVGYLDLSREIWPFIAAMADLGPEFELFVVGTGPDRKEMAQRSCDAGIDDRVHFTGRVPRSAIPPILEACDAGIVTYSTTDLNSVHCAPNKIHEYAHAGLPVLGNDNPGLERIIESYEIGETTSERPPAAAIESVAANLSTYRANLADFLAAENWAVEADTLRTAYEREVVG